LIWLFVSGFFFQAEDGIRDFHVTGVQTCALPISGGPGGQAVPAGGRGEVAPVAVVIAQLTQREGRRRALVRGMAGLQLQAVAARSEERRVGKEWRCWGAV